jgi:hypothetical protein
VRAGKPPLEPTTPAPADPRAGDVLAATLCYAPLGCLPLLAGAACWLLYRSEPARRFHAAQGLLLQAAAVGAGLVLWAAGHAVRGSVRDPGRILFPAWGLLFAAWAAVGLHLAARAYAGGACRLPWLGRWAAALARLSS